MTTDANAPAFDQEVLELHPESEDDERKRHNRAALIVLTRFSFEMSPRSVQEIFTGEETTRFFLSTCVFLKMVALANAGKPANPPDVVEAIRNSFLETKAQLVATLSKGYLSEQGNAALVKKTKRQIDVICRRSVEAREMYLQEQQLQKDSKFPLSKDGLDALFASVYPFISKSQLHMYGDMAEIRKAYEVRALQRVLAVAMTSDKQTADEITCRIEAQEISEVNERRRLEAERREQVAKRVEEARQKQKDKELERKYLEQEREAAYKKRREEEAREAAVAALIKKTASDAIKSVVSAAAAAAAAKKRASERAFQEVFNVNRAAAQRRSATLKERERLAVVKGRAERRGL